MPLINTEEQEQLVQQVLQESGISPSKGRSNVSDIMDAHGLDEDELVVKLKNIMDNGQSDHIRLRAIESALKMKGALREEQIKVIPVFNITINDPSAPSYDVNPILIPREASL